MDAIFIGALLIAGPFIGCYLALVLYFTGQERAASVREDLAPR